MNGLIIDCFAGGGGASTGIEMALGRPVDIAINHDPQAILMHKTNHPNTLHLTEDIFKVDLKKYVGDKHVFLMWASPDCSMCGFGIHLEQRPHRFDRLREQNEKEWHYWMYECSMDKNTGKKYGWGRVLDYIGVPWEDLPAVQMTIDEYLGTEAGK